VSNRNNNNPDNRNNNNGFRLASTAEVMPGVAGQSLDGRNVPHQSVPHTRCPARRPVSGMPQGMQGQSFG